MPLQTLAQFLLNLLADHPERLGLSQVLQDLSTIGKFIARETARVGIMGNAGGAGGQNFSGDAVQKLDVLANEQCKSYLASAGHIAALAPEEEESVVRVGNGSASAKYVVAFDPLDGSSNINVNGSMGTIFSVHNLLPEFDRADEKQFLQAGRTQVLAGYILFGPSTILVFSFGRGVYECVLDSSVGEFLVLPAPLEFSDACPHYSVNEANWPFMSPADQKFVSYLKQEKKCGTRYFAALVADVHRTLKAGGVFMYPAIDKKGDGNFTPKLRLNFELKPMAFLIEAAGGLAVSGKQNILDIVPTSLHQKEAVVLGNKSEVEYYQSLI